MPRYQFQCPDCAATFEEKRSFAQADDPAVCPDCASDGARKGIGAAMFFTPGSAAKALLDPKPAAAPASHAAGCPCCSPSRRPLTHDPA